MSKVYLRGGSRTFKGGGGGGVGTMSAKGTSFHGGLDASSPRNVSKIAISSILRQLLHSFNANFLFIDFCSKKLGGRVGGGGGAPPYMYLNKGPLSKYCPQKVLTRIKSKKF